jgi:hypothetical protein
LKTARQDLRQRFSRIERKPKPVRAVEFQDFAGVGKNPTLRMELERAAAIASFKRKAGLD